MRRAGVCREPADVAFIDLEYASGPIAHVELSWLAPSKLRRTTIVGSEKMVVYDDTSNEPVRVFDSVHASPPAGDLRRVQADVVPPATSCPPVSTRQSHFRSS